MKVVENLTNANENVNLPLVDLLDVGRAKGWFVLVDGWSGLDVGWLEVGLEGGWLVGLVGFAEVLELLFFITKPSLSVVSSKKNKS